MAGELTRAGADRGVQAGAGEAVSAAAGMYVALGTAQPGAPDTATLQDFAADELTTAGYERLAVTWEAPAGDPSLISNDAAREFGPFTADPPEVGYAFLCTAASGTVGDVLAYWTADTPRDAAIDDYLRFAVNALSISLD